MSGGLFCGMSCAKREQIPSTIRVISIFFIKVSFHLRRSATRDLNLARAVGGDGHANRCKTVFRLTILYGNGGTKFQKMREVLFDAAEPYRLFQTNNPLGEATAWAKEFVISRSSVRVRLPAPPL